VPSPATKDRLLDTAEQLFANRGYEGTSLRALTAAADVNLAAVHYHFGSKKALFRAVFERRVGPVNAERLRLLDQAEAAAGGAPVDLDTLLEAFLGPPLRMSARGDRGFRRFLRIVARMHSSTGEHALALRDVFHEVQRRFFPAFGRSLPHLGERDLYWRMYLVIGAMLNLFADPARLTVLSGGRCKGEDPDEALTELIAFARGALASAPSASPAGAGAKGEER
jgi:AcrR family transcriptional regulator